MMECQGRQVTDLHLKSILTVNSCVHCRQTRITTIRKLLQALVFHFASITTHSCKEWEAGTNWLATILLSTSCTKRMCSLITVSKDLLIQSCNCCTTLKFLHNTITQAQMQHRSMQRHTHKKKVGMAHKNTKLGINYTVLLSHLNKVHSACKKTLAKVFK